MKTLPYFEANKATYDTSKDTAKALVGFGTSIASTLTGHKDDGSVIIMPPFPLANNSLPLSSCLSSPGYKLTTFARSSGWTAEKQAAFSDYMGQAVTGWGNVTELTLKKLFNGDDDSLSTLTTMVANGHLIEGSVNGHAAFPTVTVSDGTLSALAADIAKGFFAYAISTVWPLADYHAFVLDSGFDCGTTDPEGTYISSDDMHSTFGCVNGKLYYLVYPKGDATTGCNTGSPFDNCVNNKFTAPPGLDALDGSRFGGVTRDDLITGSVRTYVQNGNANGGAATDPANSGSLSDLMDADITTPGFIRLPVCSAEEAWNAWNTADKSSPNWPCFVKQGTDDCGASSFTDQTSGASPSVSDCQGIIDNIQGTDGEWEVENAVEQQHQIVQFGSCKFGVQGKKINGNINFHVGAQDIIDVIGQSIKQFGGGGKVGAKGNMDCKGDVNTVPIEWGIY